MNTESLDKWEDAAMELPEPVPGLRAPFAVLSGEARDCARFARRHWEPRLTKSGKPARPGLSSAVVAIGLSASVPESSERPRQVAPGEEPVPVAGVGW